MVAERKNNNYNYYVQYICLHAAPLILQDFYCYQGIDIYLHIYISTRTRKLDGINFAAERYERKSLHGAVINFLRQRRICGSMVPKEIRLSRKSPIICPVI